MLLICERSAAFHSSVLTDSTAPPLGSTPTVDLAERPILLTPIPSRRISHPLIHRLTLAHVPKRRRYSRRNQPIHAHRALSTRLVADHYIATSLIGDRKRCYVVCLRKQSSSYVSCVIAFALVISSPFRSLVLVLSRGPLPPCG